MSKLSKDDTANLSMELVAYAGESTSLNLKAIKAAQDGDYDLANKLVADAENELTNAHKIHADILQKEAQGLEPDINTLFIHAQDHLTKALMYNDLSKIIIDLYVKVDKKRGVK